jgi:immune inhibitor A
MGKPVRTYQWAVFFVALAILICVSPEEPKKSPPSIDPDVDIESLIPQGVPASPEIAVYWQPSGHHFKAYAFGDEKYHWLETKEGYTVKHNFKTKYYEYMGVNARGQFKTLGLKPGIDQIDGLGIQKKIRESKKVRAEKIQRFIAEKSKVALADGVQQKAVNTFGTVKKLVILANFSDTSYNYSQSAFNGLFNTPGYSSYGTQGSVWDYYNEASYGNLNLETTVSVWVTLPHTMAYYGANDAAGDDVKPREMVVDAIDALNATGFNFAPFDTDDNGWIDAFAVIHQGRGEEAGGGVNTIWSHKWGISPKQVDGIWISTYYTAPEQYYTGISTIGVYAHEFGHSLGLPDLYDIDYSSKGISSWGIMAGGSWNSSGRRPAHFTAWCKSQLGWITPTEITASANGLTINRINDNAQAYKITYGMGTDEYYLIENRQSSGFDNGLPGNGIIITHVDDTRSNNTNENRYWVGVVQADGLEELENNSGIADSGDPFPGSTNNRTINYSTNPQIFSYTLSGDREVEISNISDSGSAMTFDVELGGAPPTTLQVTLSPQGAIDDGAQWRVQGSSTWNNSGDTIGGVSGTVTLEFKETTSWNPPASYQITLTPGALNTSNATYTGKNSLTVNLGPAGAVTNGAMWRRTGTSTWLESGDTEQGIPEGSVTIEFKEATNYITPSNQTFSIGASETVTRTGTYVKKSSITVTINPQGARDAGARWRRQGTTTWFASGYTEEGLDSGGYVIEFNDVVGYNTPSDLPYNLSLSEDASLSTTYTEKATLTVTLNPSQAASAGAQWRRVGTTTWFNSGATESGLDAGTYDIEYKDIDDYNTPSDGEITLSESEHGTTSATYTPKYSLKVTITPAGAVAGGAKWRRTGTSTWLDSGANETGLPNGTVTIEFRAAPGYATPADLEQTISGMYVAAPTVAYPAITFSVNASNESGENGDQVTVSASISDGTGVRAFGADFVFDTTYLEYVDVATKGVAVPGIFTFDSNLIGDNTIRIGGISGDGETSLSGGTGVIATFPLKIKDDVDFDLVSAITVTGLTDDLATATPVNGSVSISSTIINLDVNKDGSVTPGDALMVLQHYLGTSAITDPISLARANANGDGSITPGDALIVLKEYLGLNE